MITREQAERLVYERINAPDPCWRDKPEMIVTRVDDHELGWVVCYDSRPHHETGELRFAIAGNAPYLVSREHGTLFVTGTAPPFEERLRSAEQKLRAHLARDTSSVKTERSNPAGAVEAPIARLFAIIYQWRRATDQHRSAHYENVA